MKKITSYITMLMIAMTAFTFTSCDEDADIAMTLEGTWQGNMQVYHEWKGNRYEAVWSEICFEGDPFNWHEGTGYWVDYYRNSPWSRDYIANHIEWSVRNRVIYVYFVEDNYTIQIHDYRLNDNRFYGTIWDGAQSVDFQLRHVSSPNWNNYDYGWGYSYYSKGTRSTTDTDTIAPPVRHFGK